MERLETIKKLETGGKVKFETYMHTTLRENYKVYWCQSVRYCAPKKRTWVQAKEGVDFMQEDLKNERLRYLDEFRKEVESCK